MKQAILHFHSGDYLLVELPKWVTEITYGGRTKVHFDGVYVDKLIGKLSEVTEEQFARIVQVISNGRISGKPQYRKYNDKTLIPANMWVRSARDSFYSKMEAEGLYAENPRGSFEDAVTAPTGCAARVPEEIAWEDAEEKTFPPDRSFLFRILNQQP